MEIRKGNSSLDNGLDGPHVAQFLDSYEPDMGVSTLNPVNPKT